MQKENWYFLIGLALVIVVTVAVADVAINLNNGLKAYILGFMNAFIVAKLAFFSWWDSTPKDN